MTPAAKHVIVQTLLSLEDIGALKSEGTRRWNEIGVKLEQAAPNWNGSGRILER